MFHGSKSWKTSPVPRSKFRSTCSNAMTAFNFPVPLTVLPEEIFTTSRDLALFEKLDKLALSRHDTRANCFRTRFRIVAVNGGTFPFSSSINISKGRRSCSREKASREKKSAPSFCSENSVESRCLLFSSSSQARPFSSLSAFHRLSRQCVSEIYLLAWTTTTTTTVSLSVNLASQNALPCLFPRPVPI